MIVELTPEELKYREMRRMANRKHYLKNETKYKDYQKNYQVVYREDHKIEMQKYQKAYRLKDKKS